MNTAIKTAITIAGTQKGLAKACGVTQSAVQKWLHNRTKVSPGNVKLLVKATNGVIQGHEIRPDLPDLFPPPDKVVLSGQSQNNPHNTPHEQERDN